MGQRINFHSENHHYENLNIPIRDQGISRQGIYIGNDCWIGSNVIFLDGSNLGSGCVVAAGAVVKGEIPSNSVIGGIPAKILKIRGSKTEQ